MNTTYRATAARIYQELAEIDLVVARVKGIWERRRQDLPPSDQDSVDHKASSQGLNL